MRGTQEFIQAMKILHVMSSVDPTGGGPIEGVQQLGRVLVKNGHTVHIATADAPDAPWLREIALPVHALGPARLGRYAYAPRLETWLRANHARYDAIIVNGLWQFHGLATWRALRLTQTPYFVFTHGMLDPWFKHTYPLKHLKKSLYWHRAERRVLRDARGVCFTCEEERVLARQSFARYKCREKVVSYGTAAPQGDAQAQREAFLGCFPHLRGKRALLFLSRIHEKKGCDLLIEAFARVAGNDEKLHLVMAGPDQTGWQTQLQVQAQKLGIAKRVTWTGMLSGDLKWGAFRSAEAFVLPSHQENFGIAVAEALACGLPVLISDKVNIWREIENDKAGLVAPDTLAGTQHLLQSWMDLPVAQQLEMRRRAVQCFEDRFEIDRAVQSLLEVLQSDSTAP